MAIQRLELEAQHRSVTGKKVRFLRRAGITPANIYGHGMASVAVEVETVPLRRLLRSAGRSSLVTLKVRGTAASYTVMVRDVVQNPISDLLMHVDFYQVQMTERLRVEVPVHLFGTSPAVDRGEGILVQNLRTVHVEALPGDLPPSIDVDVSGLGDVHAAIFVRDLKVSAGVTLLADPEDHVVSVAFSRIQEEVAEAPAEAEPARIIREREEGEAEKK